MGCFQVRYDSRVIIYERKLFIRLATGQTFLLRPFRIAAIRYFTLLKDRYKMQLKYWRRKTFDHFNTDRNGLKHEALEHKKLMHQIDRPN